MSFFQSDVVRFQMIVLVLIMLLVAGSVFVLPETTDFEIPVASHVAETAAPQDNIGSNEGAAANDIPDQQALAAYQFDWAKMDIASRYGKNREHAVIDTLPNQVPDQKTLAAYQFLWAKMDIASRYGENREPAVIDAVPNQVADR